MPRAICGSPRSAAVWPYTIPSATRGRYTAPQRICRITQTQAITSDPSGRIWTTTAGGLVLRQGNDVAHVPRAGNARSIHIAWTMSPPMPIGRGYRAIRRSRCAASSPARSATSSRRFRRSRRSRPHRARRSSSTATTSTIAGRSSTSSSSPTGSNHFPTMAAEVISVTTTSIAVKVPRAGRQRQIAGGSQRPEIAAERGRFQLMPKITSISATCLSVGSELKISGLGFLDGSAAAYVKIGSGAERIADATDPTQVRTFIRPGDTSGQVRVRMLNNNQVIANQSLSLATIAGESDQSAAGHRRRAADLGQEHAGAVGRDVRRLQRRADHARLADVEIQRRTDHRAAVRSTFPTARHCRRRCPASRWITRSA